MKMVIITDVWEPQINGVVSTLKTISQQLMKLGHQVTVLSPIGHRTLTFPGYKSIQLAIFPSKKLIRDIETINADAIHIATEGPLGMAARRWCLKNNVTFTTSYHLQTPEYRHLRLPIPRRWRYAWLRRFHSKAIYTLVPTESLKLRLKSHGFRHVKVWGRGVDTTIFNANSPRTFDYPKPIMVHMGRIAIENNIDAFLSLDMPGTKLIIGNGPYLKRLKQKYPYAVFVGSKYGDDLASWLSGSDVFVFPSKTDTSGLVNLEALACGLAVAAYPVTQPNDILQQGITESRHQDLGVAINLALKLNAQDCIDHATKMSETKVSTAFASYLHNGRASSPTRSLFDPDYMKLSA